MSMLGRVAPFLAGAAPISFVGTSTSGAGTPAKPAGTVAGDIILMFGASTSSAVWTPPAGFTDMFGLTPGNGAGCYRIADGTEGSSFSYTNGGSFLGVAVAVFRGASGVDVIGASNAQTSVSTIDGLSVTTTKSGDMLVMGVGATAGVSFSSVTGMTTITAGTTNPPVGMYYQLLSAIGATGNRTVNTVGGSTNLFSGMIALKP